MADLTRGELIELNRKLLPLGERVCSCCWRRRDIQHFYLSRRNYKGGIREDYSSQCKTCLIERNAQRARVRYRTDPAYRAAKLESTKRWQRENPDKYNPISGRSKRKRFARKLAAALGKGEIT